ncbi:MAG: FG-GAP-like repeat-containing protein [Planctomycetota bacterium]
MRSGKIDAARSIAESVPKDDDQWGLSRYLLGTMEWKSESFDRACEYFDQIPSNGNVQSLEAAELMSEHYLMNCRLSKAAEKLEYLFRFDGGSNEQRVTLATILVLGGRRSRADYHLMELLRSGQIELKELVLLTIPDRRPPESQVFLRCQQKDTSDALTNFAAATVELNLQNYEAAVKRLETAVAAEPKFAEAHALLGETLLSLDRQRFEQWLISLPQTVANHTSIWFVKGLHARSCGQTKAAVRCFWETAKKDPLHRRAVFQLGQSLSEFDSAAAEAFARRAGLLGEAELLVERVLIDEGKKTADFLRLIDILMECGRHWEAQAWITRLADESSMRQLSPEIQQSLSSMRGSSRPRFAVEADLVKKYDLSQFPIPELPENAASLSADPLTRTIHFSDKAQESGIDFTFYQSPDSESDGVRIFESTGGGTAVTDVDCDGVADILLTQGEPWPLGMDHPADHSELHDGLFRNVRARFVDISDLSGISPEGGYGQGCSSGDINNDGFQDLYIANIGTNRLLINNGDGTYSDETSLSGIAGRDWTTSCLILDLNGDGNPDLYDVNYLAGEAVYKVECSENECSVRSFEGEEDQVQLSNGDGTFRMIPDATPKENSKGLGIVALYSRPEDPPLLFIANDQVPNYLLRPDSDGKYIDEAALRGVAVNCDGQPTACMGVAIGDINDDRHADLFVTNFEAEANCLYLQDEQGFFFDSIRGTGLMTAGIPYVGWGTQFFDADNDTIPDLVVANGHVADFKKPDKEYDMPLQFFHGERQAIFHEIDGVKLGDLFTRKILGRSLAVLDWNADGKQDFLVSAVESPVILATNETDSSRHFLRIELRARRTARDAQGAAVELDAGQKIHWKQLNAGDGYQASNERVVHFGLDETSEVRSLKVSWPSGTTDGITLPDGVDRKYIVVEGQGSYLVE